MIVDTGDAMLVANRGNAQDVKQVVEELSALQHEAVEHHRSISRPWGSYHLLEQADDCKVKRLVVKPGEVLSLQRHRRRCEHWTVIRCTAKVRVGNEEFLLRRNESTFVPMGSLHRTLTGVPATLLAGVVNRLPNRRRGARPAGGVRGRMVACRWVAHRLAMHLEGSGPGPRQVRRVEPPR